MNFNMEVSLPNPKSFFLFYSNISFLDQFVVSLHIFTHVCWFFSLKEGKEGLLVKSRSRLTDIIRVCFFEAGRSIAHKCARFLALCIRYDPHSVDTATPLTDGGAFGDKCPVCFSNGKGDPAQQGFGVSLLKALIENMPYLPAAATGGEFRDTQNLHLKGNNRM